MNNEHVWAIEMFCDSGTDPLDAKVGISPLIYTAEKGLDSICMYLLLRTKEINGEIHKTGHNVFVTYMLRHDKERMRIILTRGANINYVNKLEGKTPLHIAIEHRLSPEIIKFLLKNGANPHFEDFNGVTCQEKAKDYEPYKDIKSLKSHGCSHSNTRIKP